MLTRCKNWPAHLWPHDYSIGYEPFAIGIPLLVTLPISKRFRYNEAQLYLGHGIDLSRSRDVTSQVIILSMVCVPLTTARYLELFERY